MTPTDFAKLLSNYFTQHLIIAKNCSKNTINSYKDAFKQLLLFANSKMNISEKKLQIKDITKSFILDFLNWLETENNSNIRTRNQRLAVLHSFFSYVQHNEPDKIFQCQEILSIKTKKFTINSVDFLTSEDLQILLNQPNPIIKNERKHLVLLSLMYDTGARVQEICDLKVSNIIFNNNDIYIKITGKGNKTRIVPIDEKMKNLLNKYLNDFSLNNSENNDCYLFTNHSKNKLSRQGITHILNKYYLIACSNHLFKNPIKISPHTLRHTRAIHLLQAGVDLIYIRDILGHSSVKTTELYARVITEQKRTAIEKVSGNINDQIPEWNINADLLEWLNSFK
ncbi:MAG: site-specific integrase [Deltaproteobacteria bacterium]|jgi:site-specific recombinase XerD|nr:site-specific integrase [Deltaproteobacteria bacterium]